MSESKNILVTGGTGKQGGAVARNLIQNGYTVKVLTRNPDSPNALALKNQNAILVKGDLNKPETYREHLNGVHGVFSVQTFENGVNKEISQGIGLATLAMESGVKHFLYSSAIAAHLNTGVPHLDSKFVIENHIRQLALPYTIIRPASFYENFLIPQVKKGILKGKLSQTINSDTIMPYIATDDIGKAAVKIFGNFQAYSGKTLTLGNELLDSLQVAEKFSIALNKKVEYNHLPGIIVRLFLGKSLYKMFSWMDKHSKLLMDDVTSDRAEFPEMMPLSNWIKTNFKA
ncbi:NmrA/HSCARG family protein [Daejeonella sp.]|uniref:NmrA/HSCARG family protein n=1 Tax=Daejeonella sp. TaxID=2805397 RepID=UPI0039834333